MCTVTVVPHRDGTRLVCNRDERRTRALAVPPDLTFAGSRPAVYPIDPESGGTWVGVNDCGLAVALLNANHGMPVEPATRAAAHATVPFESRGGSTSRGGIVPRLLGCSSLRELMACASAIDHRRFTPFRVLAVQGREAVIIGDSEGGWRLQPRAVRRPLMLTSSALGDHHVDGPRRRLFSRLMANPATWLEAQQRFHRHQWVHRPDISVLMRRQDARTVSRTEIDLAPGRASLRYHAFDREAPAS